MKPEKLTQFQKKSFWKVLFVLGITLLSLNVSAQGTRLLRQPDVTGSFVCFTYGADIWVAGTDGSDVSRITSTSAVEECPVLSPDAKYIAFTSNRSGTAAVYVVPRTGGTPKRLTWHPSGAYVRGWTNDGKKILFASGRDFAPRPVNRLWTVPFEGGIPELLTVQRGNDGSFSPDGSKIALDRISRWDKEWRGYRGGQNTPLVILNLQDLSESLISNEKTTDTDPVWIGSTIYFLSDRDGVMNIWAYHPDDHNLEQITDYSGSDIKNLSGKSMLTFERDGFLYLLDPGNKEIQQLEINLSGDFPWSETRWEDVKSSIEVSSLSPTGKRIIMQARGDIFTVPAEHGTVRNITSSPGVADRQPIWSPEGDRIAWFSEQGKKGYSLVINEQDGLSEPEVIDIGESRLAWEPAWSPDGKWIAFVDDDLRIRIVDIKKKETETIGLGGINIERGRMGLSWSPDSKFLAYSRTGSNNFRQIMLWSRDEKDTKVITNRFADSFSPSWSDDGKYLFLLASTDVALASGWTNTSAMNAQPEYAAYVIVLNAEVSSPFKLKSDEEGDSKKEDSENGDMQEDDDKEKDDSATDKSKKKKEVKVDIDFKNIDRRIIPLPMPVRNYSFIAAGRKDLVFLAERIPNKSGLTLHKFEMSKKKSTEYLDGARSISLSHDRKKILVRTGDTWKIAECSKAFSSAKNVDVRLLMKIDPLAEWEQIFEEAWRYEKDYFYDPGLHGRDWNEVYERYAPLLPYIKHRADLNYVLDMMNGELSVGHSFVGGGDYPEVERQRCGMIGADLKISNGGWMIDRIYTSEVWNPELSSPLDQPNVKVKEGNYLVGINGRKLTPADNPFEFLDGTAGKQTVLHICETTDFSKSWEITVSPITSEYELRQRAWVEDNRRLVDSLSGGRLAYVWVPNTSSQGLVSFNRYFFAQQDKEGAVIDERYNGGGLLDDYMVDLMTRKLRAAYTNEVPGAAPRQMPSGILGPKVLLINEMSGSGGDFFPWVFRHQNAGLLIGTTTWGGLVKSSVHYRFIDGGTMTAPDNAIFDPVKHEWIAENKGIPPDIHVMQDAKSLSQGRDPQLERAVKELLKQLDKEPFKIERPPFSTPAKIEK